MTTITINFRILWILLLATNLSGQDLTESKVLFVGNSYTYFWNLPQQVGAMSLESDHHLITSQSTIGGSNLGQHWRGDRKLKSRQLIENGNFDVVVIQDHSMRAVNHIDSLMHYGQLFGALIKEKGARVYLYETWARTWDPLMQEPITQGYARLAEKLNAEVVPVGQVWARALSLRPDLNLFDPDGSHPSPLGSYLTACVFYGKLTGHSPVGLPHRLVTKDADGEKFYLNIQSENDALFCQKVAAEILFKPKKKYQCHY